jgi:hypothetical protein
MLAKHALEGEVYFGVEVADDHDEGGCRPRAVGMGGLSVGAGCGPGKPSRLALLPRLITLSQLAECQRPPRPGSTQQAKGKT